MVMDPLEKTRSVKKRWEKKLLRIKGVQGVGVGKIDGAPVISVYVDHGQPDSTKIPLNLEGVPVSIKETGAFTGQGAPRRRMWLPWR